MGNICRINHSCMPNLAFDLAWNDDKKTVYNHVSATTAIAEGDEVNISYLPVRLQLPVGERRKQLREHWGFPCDCARCMDEGGPPDVEATEVPSPPDHVNSEPPPAIAERYARKRASSSSSSEGVCFDDLGD